MPELRGRRRLAWASAVLGTVVVAIVAAAWIQRDLPRRKVESGLAGRLEAKVGVGRFTVEGLRRFVLHDLVVTHLAGQNRVRRVSIGTLVVEGNPTEILSGRFESLEATAVELRLGPPDPSVPEPSAPPAEISAGRFRLDDARVVLEGADAKAVASLAADLSGIGGDLAGTVTAASERIPLATLLAVVGASGASGLGGEARLTTATAQFAKGGSQIALRLGADEAVVARAGREVPIFRLAIALALSPNAETKLLDFEAEASLTGIDEARARGTYDERGRRIVTADAAVRGLDLAAWLPLVPGIPPTATTAGRLDATARLTPDTPLRWTAHAAIEHAQAPAGADAEDRVRIESADLEVEGEMDATRPTEGGPVKATLSVSALRGSLAGKTIPASVAPLRAAFDGRISGTSVRSLSGDVVLENAVTGPVTAAVRAEASAASFTASARWRLAPTELASVLTLARDAGLAIPPGLKLDGNVSAEGEAAWPSTTGTLVTARLRMTDLSATVPTAGASQESTSVSGATIAAALTWRAPSAPIAVEGLIFEGSLHSSPFPRTPLRVSGRALVEPSTPTIGAAAFDIASPGLFQATASGNWSKLSGGAFVLKLAEAELSRWRDFLRPLLGEVAPDYAVKGRATVGVAGTIDENLVWSGRGTAAIAKSGFASGDGARVLEGLDTTWDVAVEGRSISTGAARATARVEGFQILWDSFFADYSTLPSSLTAEATFDAVEPATKWSARLSWRYPDGPELDARARGAGRGPVHFESEVAVANIGTMLAKYLRAPLGDSVKLFNRIEGDGSLRVRARGSLGKDETIVTGRVRLEDTRIEGTKGFVEVAGLDLDLPFDLRWGAADAAGARPLTGAPLSGSLGFEKLEIWGLALAETSTPLRIEADTIGLDEGLAVPLFGGALGFEKLTVIEALRPSRRAETAILLSGLSLRDASAAFSLPPLDGEADGYFPAVRLQGSSFEVKGGGEISVFGGKLKIGGISGEDILTRFPKLRLSADFEAIDLEKLTGTFDFGDMTGIVKGYVHDVELFRGVPTRFDARLETVATKGLRHKINVKAVNNIAILSTGGNVGILDRGIHKFIDAFTYDRIGVELRLANDVFVMRGLEHRGDKELFVRGRLPFPIDVVNAQPGRTVSFRSMLDRLGAIDFAGVTTKGPK